MLWQILNIGLAICAWRFLRTGGPDMLKMMDPGRPHPPIWGVTGRRSQSNVLLVFS